MDDYSLCVGFSSHPEYGWLCVFEGTKEECQKYFEDGKIPEEYDKVFMMNGIEEVTLRGTC